MLKNDRARVAQLHAQLEALKTVIATGEVRNAKKERRPKKQAEKRAGKTFPLSHVERARERLQTQALAYEYLAGHGADVFRGNEARGPSKLLAMPDGSQRPARLEHVLEIEAELRRLAYEARSLMRRINEAGVLVDPEVVAHDDIPQGPSPPPGEGVVDVGDRLPATNDYDRRPLPRSALRGR